MTRRLRAVWSALRTGLTYADGYRDASNDDAFVGELVDDFETAMRNNHLAARVAVENFPLGKPRLTLVTGGA